MKHLGFFEQYSPALDAAGFKATSGVIYLKNSDETDWHSYQLDKNLGEGLFVQVENGNVTNVSDDISMLTPINADIYQVESPNQITIGWQYNDGEFSAPSERNRSLTPISQKSFRIALSRRGIYKLIPKVLSDIPDEEKKEEAEIAWEFADFFDPNDPATLSLMEIFVTHPDIPLDEDRFWKLWREAMTQ